MISNGNPISERKRLAVEMFEKGNYKGVMEVLNEADIVSDYEHAKAELASGRKVVETGEVMVANAEQKIRSLVEEFIMKAKTWMSTYSAPHRFESTCKCYEQAIQMTRESLQMKDLAEMVREYALFLLENKQYNRAEVYCKEALSISGHLASQHPEGYNSDLAKTLNNLANVYYNMQRFADAEACYQRSLAMYERLASEHLETYGSDLAMTLHSLAYVYYNTQFFTDAEEYCLRSLSIYERLVAANPDIYGYSYAGSLMSAAYYSLFNKKYAQSEEYSREALKWSDDIYIYTNLAAAILLQGRYDEAKQIYWTYRDNLKDSFLEDIQALKDNNAIPTHIISDVDKIIELLLNDL